LAAPCWQLARPLTHCALCHSFSPIPAA
jgi:hypothetical protein